MERWQFPHTVGAIDGKHIRIRNPPHGGSEFYNYTHFFSIILMALVDADYKFLWTHIGTSGSNNDAGIFMRSELRECLREGTLNLPDPEPLSGDTEPMPYYIIGDDAFPLRTWCMKPYSRLDLDIQHRVFNYRLSRARRVVENAFGMLATKFRCLLNHMTQKPERVQTMVLAACCLHNLMRIRYTPRRTPDWPTVKTNRPTKLSPENGEKACNSHLLMPAAGLVIARSDWDGNREKRSPSTFIPMLVQWTGSWT